MYILHGLFPLLKEDGMDDRDVTILSNYIHKIYPEEYVCFSSYEFDKRSHSKWAATEILELMCKEANKLPSYISGRETATPLDVIEDFLIDMNYYAEICDDSKMQFMFNTARDEAKKILQLYLKGDSNG